MGAVSDKGYTTGILAALVLAVVTTAGLYHVKWQHYYQVCLQVAAGASLGKSPLVAPANARALVSWHAAVDYARAYWSAVWRALLLALVVGAGLKALVPRRWISRALGGPGFGTTTLGGLAAIPSMMCTCCAAPMTVALRESGASPAAALAFWLGNPLLNPATLVLTAMMLGRGWAVLRLGAGLLLVFGCASFMVLSCGESGSKIYPDIAHVEPPEAAVEGWNAAALRWARELGRLAFRLVPEYLVLMLALGGIRAWLFASALSGADNSLPWLIGMAAAGTLFVIPTAAEVPIVQTMLQLGVGVGPAGALLITLPAVSLPSLVMLGRAFPAKVLIAVASASVSAGVLAGLLAMTLRL